MAALIGRRRGCQPLRARRIPLATPVLLLTREPVRRHDSRSPGDDAAAAARPDGDIDMRNLILVGAFALLILSPLTALAQQKPAAPTVEPAPSAKVLAIGIGALLGAVAGQAIVAGEAVTLIGGAAG